MSETKQEPAAPAPAEKPQPARRSYLYAVFWNVTTLYWIDSTRLQEPFEPTQRQKDDCQQQLASGTAAAIPRTRKQLLELTLVEGEPWHRALIEDLAENWHILINDPAIANGDPVNGPMDRLYFYHKYTRDTSVARRWRA